MWPTEGQGCVSLKDFKDSICYNISENLNLIEDTRQVRPTDI